MHAPRQGPLLRDALHTGRQPELERLVKRFSPDRCDWLFVLVADGRRWFIPAEVLEGSGIVLGGPKYAAYEVEPGRPLTLSLAA
jgi:hypothetical protein